MRDVLTIVLRPWRAVFVLSCPVVGCIENGVSPTHADPTFATDDEFTDTGPTCENPDLAPRTVELGETCTFGEPDWNLRTKQFWDAGDRWLRAAHTGRFADSNEDGEITIQDSVGILVTALNAGSSQIVLSGDGTVQYENNQANTMDCDATVVDVDPSRLGTEFVAALRPVGALSLAGGLEPENLLYLTELPSGLDFGHPFAANLDADNIPEILGIEAAISGATGAFLFSYGDQTSSSPRTIAADLDLDGIPEILAGANGLPTVFSNSGAPLATCLVRANTEMPAGSMTFAIGNLDEDTEGEMVVARPGILAICDADGSVVVSVGTASENSSTIAIAELTGDSTPEIVLDEALPDAARTISVASYDRGLHPLWRYPVSGAEGRANIAVADLDGDGRHEILVQLGSGKLVILSPEGHKLASIDAPKTGGFDGPIVADVDGDGLAEILVAGEQPSLVLYTNDAGGWLTTGSEDVWPGRDHFPGDRNLDGSLPIVREAPWLVEGHNVWQGLAAGRPELPDIGVEIDGTCSNDCETTVIAAYVSNYGVGDDPMPIVVELRDLDDAPVADPVVLSSLSSGASQRVEFRVPSSRFSGNGLRVVAVSEWAECSDVQNEATVANPPCQ